MLYRSSVVMRDRLLPAPSTPAGPFARPEPQLLLGVSTPESTLGGERLTGFSVLRSAAGTYMGFFGRRICGAFWWWDMLKCDVERGDVGDTFIGVLAPDPIDV
jgi:hypothetical protein